MADETYLAYTATGSDRVRVSVVAETGDVYAMRFKTGEVALLGNVGITDPERGLSNSRERSPVYIQADTLVGDYTQESGPLGRPLSWFAEQAGRQFNVASIAGAASRRSQGRSSRTSKRLSFTRIRYRPVAISHVLVCWMVSGNRRNAVGPRLRAGGPVVSVI